METRSYQGFKDYTVLGNESEFAGAIEYQIVLWSKQDSTLRAFCVSKGAVNKRLSGDCLEAVKAAIKAWGGLNTN
jgi:hypothetical protein